MKIIYYQKLSYNEDEERNLNADNCWQKTNEAH